MKAHITTSFFLVSLLCTTLLHAQKIVAVHAMTPKSGKIYVLNPTGTTYNVQETFFCKFGMNGVNKQRVYDKRTPLGHYKIKKESSRRRERQKFGGYFVEIDYPNFYDRRAGKTGSDIGFHGGRNNYTLGCIRILDGGAGISTVNIAKLVKLTRIGTHVIITKVLPPALTAKEGEALTSEAAEFWQKVVAKRRSYTYLVHEAQKFNGSYSQQLAYNLGKIDDKEAVVNLRTGPSEDANLLGIVLKGKPFLFARHDNDWHKVFLANGIEGYLLHKEVVEVMYEPTGKAIINDPDGWTNVRAAGTMKAKIKGKIKEDQNFWYKENVTDWWKVVAEDGMEGYMHYSRISPVKQAYRFSINPALLDIQPSR